jgi:hypothetical protein
MLTQAMIIVIIRENTKYSVVPELIIKSYLGEQAKEDGMDKVCSTHG